MIRPWRSERVPVRLPVGCIEEDWLDPSREREIPLRVYLPDEAWGRCPVVVMSHGFGWSRRHYAAFGRYWATYGFVCVHPEHKGSDRSAWRDDLPVETLRRLGSDPQIRLDRVQDVRFILDNLAAASWRERIDLGKVGMAGHSYGAHTALTLAGQVMTLPGGRVALLADPRVRAMTVFSPAAPADPKNWDHQRILRNVAIPGLHVAGANDVSPMRLTRSSDRRVAFDHIVRCDQYLLILKDAGHTTFACDPGASTTDLGSRTALATACLVSLAFWDSYLHGREAARQWLTSGDCAAAVSPSASWEWKVESGLLIPTDD
jgi:predicted dienelactone hydrolase